jgi:hypothetical protein
LTTAAKAGTPVIVHVVARTTAAGRVAFSHRWHWQGSGAEKKGSIDVPARRPAEDRTPVHFHFKDQTNPPRSLVFADSADGPIWVRRGICPAADQPSRDPEIPVAEIHRSPHLLKVVDENSEVCTLHYRLRFTDRAGRHLSYDPEIKNGGTNAA